MLSRLSYANVIATIALFVALGGSSYAALNLPKGSVGPPQLQKNSVSSVKVKPGSLLKSDFRKSHRAKLIGPQGPQGVQGPKGAPGSPGATTVTVRNSGLTDVLPDTPKTETADCLPGEVATGGGIQTTNGHTGDMMVGVSMPILDPAGKPVGWTARAYNVDHDNDDAETIAVRAYAICASP